LAVMIVLRYNSARSYDEEAQARSTPTVEKVYPSFDQPLQYGTFG